MSAGWIKRLTLSDSRLHKEDVLRQALELACLGDEPAKMFLSLLKACYDPFATYGVKQVAETIGLVDRENPWVDFVTLLDKLQLRLLTGNAARHAVEDIAQRFDSDNWNLFCAAVIRKDIRAGISEKTINKVVKGTIYTVPVFSCQLATSCEGRPEMKGIKRLEPKLDGVRVLMVVKISGDSVSAVSYSRNGKIFENFGHIELQVMQNISKFTRSFASNAMVDGFVLDGEVIGRSFQDLMRQARRKENVEASDSVFHIFDVLPLADFNRGYSNIKLASRISMLDKLRKFTDLMPNVELLPNIVVDLETAAGHDQLDRYAKDCVSDGFEGIMIKNLDAPYECKRNTHWLKWKPVITVDLEVVGIEEGTGKNVGKLGALICEGKDNGKLIKVNVGSGFTDSERDSYYADQDVVIGRTVEILCDTVSQNSDGNYSLRFPRFVRFRDDK